MWCLEVVATFVYATGVGQKLTIFWSIDN